MSASLSARPDHPSQIGEFVVAGVLGEGGSGIVYDARWGHREVALKLLHPLLVVTAKEREQFVAEARRLAEIHHAGVVKVLAVGEAPDGRPFLAMEKLRGETLAARLARGPLPVAQALELFGQLADAVEALHGRGLVHRDLKPENVVLVTGADGREHAVLLDFGIAKELASPASTTTQDGGVRGTPAYMAPERFFGQPASVATDVYELAVTLFAMLAGRLPWDDCADPEVRLDPRRLADVAPHVPAALDVEVRRALSTRAQNRPASAGELRAAVMAASGIAWAPRRTVEVGSGPVAVPELGVAPTVPLRGPAPAPTPAYVPPPAPAPVPAPDAPATAAPTTRRGPSRTVYVALGLGIAAAIGIGVTASYLSTPGEKIDGERAASEAAAATEQLAAQTAAPAAAPPAEAPPATPENAAGFVAPAAPVDDAPPSLAITAALPVLPDDTLFALGVQVRALDADPDLRDVIDLFADSQPGKLLRVEAQLDDCALDVRGRADWVVLAGPADESSVDLLATGRWTRAEVEDCLRAAVAADAVEPSDRVTVLRGPRGERTVGWLDDRTFFVSSRPGADAAWMTARLADTTPPGGTIGATLAEVDTAATIWLAGDEAGTKRAQLQDDVQGIWGSLDTGKSRLELDLTFRYKNAKQAALAEKELRGEMDGLSLDGIGKLEISRVPGHPERLRFEVALPRMIASMIMEGIRTGQLRP